MESVVSEPARQIKSLVRNLSAFTTLFALGKSWDNLRSTAAPYTESRLTRSVANECVGFPVVEQSKTVVHVADRREWKKPFRGTPSLHRHLARRSSTIFITGRVSLRCIKCSRLLSPADPDTLFGRTRSTAPRSTTSSVEGSSEWRFQEQRTEIGPLSKISSNIV